MSDHHHPRIGAFLLVLVAVAALLLPSWYTVHAAPAFGPWGSLIAWTTVSVAIFGVLTVIVSVIRHFVAPALRQNLRRGDQGNL
jgi:hypothetical protein